jgi:hypothetical protein
MFDEEDGYSYTLTFSINFPHDNDTVYLAHCYPYTYRYHFERVSRETQSVKNGKAHFA